eukprot:Pgem_evm1s9878
MLINRNKKAVPKTSSTKSTKKKETSLNNSNNNNNSSNNNNITIFPETNAKKQNTVNDLGLGFPSPVRSRRRASTCTTNPTIQIFEEECIVKAKMKERSISFKATRKYSTDSNLSEYFPTNSESPNFFSMTNINNNINNNNNNNNNNNTPKNALTCPMIT